MEPATLAKLRELATGRRARGAVRHCPATCRDSARLDERRTALAKLKADPLLRSAVAPDVAGRTRSRLDSARGRARRRDQLRFAARTTARTDYFLVNASGTRFDGWLRARQAAATRGAAESTRRVVRRGDAAAPSRAALECLSTARAGRVDHRALAHHERMRMESWHDRARPPTSCPGAMSRARARALPSPGHGRWSSSSGGPNCRRRRRWTRPRAGRRSPIHARRRSRAPRVIA